VVLVVLVVPGRPFVVEKDQKNMNQYRFSTLFFSEMWETRKNQPKFTPIQNGPENGIFPAQLRGFGQVPTPFRLMIRPGKPPKRGGNHNRKSQPLVVACLEPLEVRQFQRSDGWIGSSKNGPCSIAIG